MARITVEDCLTKENKHQRPQLHPPGATEVMTDVGNDFSLN